MWPSNVKKQKQIQNKTKTTTTLIYLIHTHTHTHSHTHHHSHAHILFLYNNLDSDRHSFIYMNIQYIYNTQLVHADLVWIRSVLTYGL